MAIAAVTLEVRLPTPDAAVVVNGADTKSVGPVRTFASGPLSASRDYVFEVTATWVRAGQTFTETRRVVGRGGDKVPVDFTTRPVDPPAALPLK